MEGTECSDTLAYKIQTLGNYPEESIQHSERGESFKSRIMRCVCDGLSFIFACSSCKTFMMNCLCAAF